MYKKKEPVNLLSVKKKEVKPPNVFRYIPTPTKKYTPKPQYQFLSKQQKQLIDMFDVSNLMWHLKEQNYIQILWSAGILIDRIKKLPDAPISEDHKAVIEKLAQIFEEWFLINERLSK